MLIAIASEAIKGEIVFQHEQHLEALNNGEIRNMNYILQCESMILSFSPDRQMAIRTLRGKTLT